ncbi:septal ring lytic transglycosylase RlpA family protein [Aestuariibacter sp. GS-14]|uniref:septal ring lytic transglycosylase RlpA family protein n=1 Tax=Aestuariibacter sp. GS-14 TaxID=2590670 RepID=UPI00112DADDB|nr:septal ring lytic transglycosylase RlpA family protein [Aestuariibacter sp. GS-14]TPV61015.1 septal ring lytic transglycosylase RlpA family protein [Aestuariibacter sp. GS-14]
MQKFTSVCFWVLVISGLTACQAPSRYTRAVDSAPDFEYTEPEMVDAEPRYEPYREQNSLPYEVFGKRYQPMTTGKGFVQTGNASWYGQKFHGHFTSNGEIYDMFAMTAAHKTLPLPSYVRVTNLSNQESVIVRVNDRGPFHSDRIIDLSYAAAKKLGYHNNGTTSVKLEVIYVDKQNMVTVGNEPPVPYALYAGQLPNESDLHIASEAADKANLITQTQTPQPTQTIDAVSAPAGSSPVAVTTPSSDIAKGYYIQVAALSDGKRAKQLSDGLSSLYQVPAQVPLIDDIYRLRLGPLTDRFQLQMLLDELKKNGYPGAYTIEATL